LKDGTLPIMCRINVNGTKSSFSCKMSVPAGIWAGGKATGRSDEAKKINRDLARIEESVRGHYRRLEDRDSHVTAERIKNEHLGLSMNHETLLGLYGQHILDYRKLIEAGLRAPGSITVYITVFEHLKEFVRQRYKVGDIGLKEIAPAFITDFEIFLKTDKHCSHNTVWIYMIPLQKMISIALKNRILLYDPFVDYKIRKEDTDRVRLDSKEIKALMSAELRGKKELARDLFIFCTFTGLAFIDLYTLRKEHIHEDGKGRVWLVKDRRKTGVESVIRLMDVPRRIMEKYDGLATDGNVFPVPEYEKLRTCIKAVAKSCGIEKNVTWHTARHTMATEVCLTHGMPIESVSKILGHKNIKETQRYAKVTRAKSNYDMDRLESRLSQDSDFQGLAL
jgi:site-specific recombinase XerD